MGSDSLPDDLGPAFNHVACDVDHLKVFAVSVIARVDDSPPHVM